jgi:hypothetical protein
MSSAFVSPPPLQSYRQPNDAPLALEPLKLEFLKWQSFEILQEEGFFLRAQEIRLVAETIGQRIASEEIEEWLPPRTRLLPGTGHRLFCRPYSHTLAPSVIGILLIPAAYVEFHCAPLRGRQASSHAGPRLSSRPYGNDPSREERGSRLGLSRAVRSARRKSIP